MKRQLKRQIEAMERERKKNKQTGKNASAEIIKRNITELQHLKYFRHTFLPTGSNYCLYLDIINTQKGGH